MTLSSADIKGSLDLIIATFREVQPELMKYYGNVEHISKSDNSPVTELDVKVETLVKQRLAQSYPHIGFHGEETDVTVGTSGATWFVDPIDGTSSFIHGLPYCTNMAGLVVDGQTVAAVIFAFASDEMYTAMKGEGAYKNGKKIQVKNTPLDNSLLFVSSFVYNNLYHLFKSHKIGVFAPLGASGYEFTRLAQGSIQGVTKLNCGSMMHDDVPGVLIAQEAGAEVVSFAGDTYTYDTLQFVIGTPNLTEVIREHRAEIINITTRR